jgi:hypothetical protein
VKLDRLLPGDRRDPEDGSHGSGSGEAAAHGEADLLKTLHETWPTIAYDQGYELVGKSPKSALLMAGAIGFALGVILTRKSKPSE